MYRKLLTLSFLILLLNACASQRTPISPGTIPTQKSTEVTEADIHYGQQVLAQFKRKFKISNDRKALIRVRDIVEKLAEAADAGSSGWQVYILEGDKILNAAATRGNFIFVWTGMIEKVASDSELATVLAHEMGHVLARHTNRTPAEEANHVLTGIAGAAARGVIANNAHASVAKLGAALVQQIVAAAIINPESQRVELEADHIGLFLMAKAGYNPESALTFWKKLSSSRHYSGMSLNFLSSHPSSDQRIAQIKALLPEAMRYYRGSGKKSVTSSRSNSFIIKKQAKHPKTETWIVEEEWTNVYPQASNKQRPITRLFYGQRIKAQPQGRWLKVFKPKIGFVPSRDCSPARR